jgi:leucyl-tRNA synthetase
MIKGISEDIQQLKFNTAVSKMMIYVNEISDLDVIRLSDFLSFLVVLAPFATKISQELWTQLGQSGLIKEQTRPDYDPTMIQTQTVNLPVQINGKTRGNLNVSKGLSQDEALDLIKADPKLSKYLDDVTIKKVIYVQDKIVNVIV